MKAGHVQHGCISLLPRFRDPVNPFIIRNIDKREAFLESKELDCRTCASLLKASKQAAEASSSPPSEYETSSPKSR